MTMVVNVASSNTNFYREGPTNPAMSTRGSRETAQRRGSIVALFGIEIDQVSMKDDLAILFRWLDDNLSGCRYVVTPNVNHIVHLQDNPRLRAAYADASLVT